MTHHSQGDEPIEDYLDDLFGALPGDPRSVRRTLGEAQEHLLDAAAAHETAGMSPLEAQRAAVADFGSPTELSRQFGAMDLRDLLRPGILFAAVGLLAIGVSGVVSEAMGRLWGPGFVAGDLPGTTYTPARCAYFQEYFPGHDCLGSAAVHHWGEVVQYRVAAGVLGLILLLAWRLMPRRRPLHAAYVALAGTGVFGAASLALAVETASSSAAGWSGAGQWLSAALVAAVVAAAYVARLARDLGRPPPRIATGRATEQ